MPQINRADAVALINQMNASTIWQQAVEESAALRTFRKVNMGTKMTRYPVIGALPSADFVTGEDVDDAYAIKNTTSMSWTDRTLTAEEIAGIVLIPENVIDDAANDFDIWNEVRPRIAEAVGVTLDEAVFFGTNAPASWPVGLIPRAIALGNTLAEGAGASVDLADDFNNVIALVEGDGYDVTAVYARRSLRARLVGLREATTNAPIFVNSLASDGARVPEVLGVPISYVRNGAWDNSVATALVGDPNFAVLGIRQDLTFKLLDQAAVTLNGNLISLAERDLLGLRFKMRVGFQTAETLTIEGGATPYPFAVLTP